MARLIPILIWILCITGSVRGQVPCLATAALAPLNSWQTISGSYGNNEWMIYEVTMYSGVDYVFKTGCGDGATADHNTVIEWMTPTCTVIMSNDDGCDSARSKLSFNSFFTDGMVLWIRVRGSQGVSGSFTMAYRSIGGVPGQCNTCPSYDAQLFPSSLWQTADSAYGTNGCKVYKVLATAGLEYTFKTGCGDGATADHDTQLELFGVGCASLMVDDNTCESGRSLVTWTAASNGALFVKVSGVNGSAGMFTMAYRRSGGNGSACGSCTAHDLSIAPGPNWLTSTSSYLAGGCQIYRVSVTDGYQYNFKTGCGNGATADHDTYLELVDASCAVLAANDDGCENGRSGLSHVANSTGFLYLKVSGSSGQEGFYTLAYRRTGTCTTCPLFNTEITPTSGWQNASGSYYNDGCWIYKVNVAQGHTYVFQTEFGNGATADHWTQLELFDDTCGSIAPEPWSAYGSRLYHLAMTTGPSYLKVHGIGSAFGSHTLAYRDVGMSQDLCSDAVPIEFGEGSMRLSGTLLGATSTDDFVATSPLVGLPVKWYALDLQSPCNALIVSYCGQDPAWSNTLNVLASSCPADVLQIGSSPFQVCSDGNADHWFSAAVPGLYYLPLLYDPVNSIDGEYVVTVICSNVVIGIGEEAGSTWSIFPNPGSDEVWLEQSGGSDQQAQFTINDLLGKAVRSGVVGGTRISLPTSSLPQGLYMVEVRDGKTTSTFMWVKQ